MPWGRSVSSVIPQLKLQAVGDHGGELLRLRADGDDLLPAVGQNTILYIVLFSRDTVPPIFFTGIVPYCAA